MKGSKILIAPAGEFFVEAALFSDTFHCDAVATEPSAVRVVGRLELGSGAMALRYEPRG